MSWDYQQLDGLKKVSEQIVIAVNNLDRSTTRLSKRMIWLTGVLVLLTVVLVWLTYKLVF